MADPLGRRTVYKYDPAGRLTQTAAPLGRIEQTRFDAVGHPTLQIDALDRQTVSTYDRLDRLTGVQDALGGRVSRTGMTRPAGWCRRPTSGARRRRRGVRPGRAADPGPGRPRPADDDRVRPGREPDPDDRRPEPQHRPQLRRPEPADRGHGRPERAGDDRVRRGRATGGGGGRPEPPDVDAYDRPDQPMAVTDTHGPTASTSATYRADDDAGTRPGPDELGRQIGPTRSAGCRGDRGRPERADDLPSMTRRATR